jgi:hypothetical protein
MAMGQMDAGRSSVGVTIDLDELVKFTYKDNKIAEIIPTKEDLFEFVIEQEVVKQWYWQFNEKSCVLSDGGTSIGCHPIMLDLDGWILPKTPFILGVACFKVLDPKTIKWFEDVNLPNRVPEGTAYPANINGYAGEWGESEGVPFLKGFTTYASLFPLGKSKLHITGKVYAWPFGWHDGATQSGNGGFLQFWLYLVGGQGIHDTWFPFSVWTGQHHDSNPNYFDFVLDAHNIPNYSECNFFNLVCTLGGDDTQRLEDVVIRVL